MMNTITELDIQLSEELRSAVLEGWIDPALVEAVDVVVDGQHVSMYRYCEAEVDKRLQALQDAGFEGTSAYQELHKFHQVRRAQMYGVTTATIPTIEATYAARPHCCVCDHNGNVQAKDGVWYCGHHWDSWMEYYGTSAATNPLKSPDVVWQEWYDTATTKCEQNRRAEAWVQ